MPIIKYADGTTDSDAIVLTDDTTQLEVDSGYARQGGVISQAGGSFGIEKTGAGTLALVANESYSGKTVVAAETLEVDLSLLASPVEVMSGATLVVAGTVGKTEIDNGGVLVPAGDYAPGKIDDDLTFAAGSSYDVGELAFYKNLDVAGTAILAGNLQVDIDSAGYSNGRYTILHADDGISGMFQSVSIVDSFGTGPATVSYDSNNVYVTLGQPVFTWTPGSGDFSAPDNWSTGTVPDSDDAATFGTASQTTITVSLNAAVKALQFDAGAPSYIFDVTAPAQDTVFDVGDLTSNSTNPVTFNIGSDGHTATLDIRNSLGNSRINVNKGGDLEIHPSYTDSTAFITLNSGGVINADTSVDPDLEDSDLLLAGGILNVLTGYYGLEFNTINGTGTVNIGQGTIDAGRSGADMQMSGAITGQGYGGLGKLGDGTLTLTNMTLDFDTLSIVGGSVVLGKGTSVTPTTMIRLHGDGKLISLVSATFGGFDADQSGSGEGPGLVGVAAGKTLAFTGQIDWSTYGPMIFGSPAYTGTITFDGSPSFGLSQPFEVAGGTLRDGTTAVSIYDPGVVASYFLQGASFTVDAGATLDLNDHSAALTLYPTEGGNLLGAGRVLLGSSASTQMRLRATNFSGVIAGAGFVTFLADADAHILTGANTYTGGTTINSGATLQIGNGGTAGSIVGNVVNASQLVFDRSNTLTFSGAISGTGSVTQAGTGKLTLTGNCTYSGGTIISAGTLQIGNGGTSGSIQGDIVDNSRLVFDRSDSVIYAGPITFAEAISGSGSLTQEGASTLALSGANSYTGGTTVSAGVLRISNDDNLGSGAITLNGGTLELVFAPGGGTLSATRHLVLGSAGGTLQASTGWTVASRISGAGPLTISGIAVTTLTGANTYSGGTDIDIGTVTFSALNNFGSGNISLDYATLLWAPGNTADISARLNVIGADGAVFDVGGNHVIFASAISGMGGLVAGGAGSLTLQGNDTFAGTVAIGGTLIVDGSLTASAISAGTEDILGGTGTVHAPGIDPGTLSPGDGGVARGLGLLTLDGDLTMKYLDGYLVDITPTASDETVVNGDAAIAGHLTLRLAAGTYVPGTTYTLLHSTGALSGTFAGTLTVAGMPDGYHAALTYDAHNMYLTIAKDGVARSDFNGDGHSDILWQDSSTGQLRIWETQGQGHVAGKLGKPLSADWQVVGTGDFNADSKSDVLLQNSSTGQVKVWLVDGFNRISGSGTLDNPGIDWIAAAIGDFNSDGRSDVVLQNSTTGQIEILMANGSNFTTDSGTVGTPAAGWHVVGSGDFNGDGNSDILLQNDNGQAAIWEMNGLTKLAGSGGVSQNLSAAWHVVGTGDFDGDGKSDVLWQNDTGSLAVWLMDGTHVTTSKALGNPGVGWTAKSVADLNGDGKSDVILQSTSGAVQAWLMNGTTITSKSMIGTAPGAAFHIVAG